MLSNILDSLVIKQNKVKSQAKEIKYLQMHTEILAGQLNKYREMIKKTTHWSIWTRIF